MQQGLRWGPGCAPQEGRWAAPQASLAPAVARAPLTHRAPLLTPPLCPPVPLQVETTQQVGISGGRGWLMCANTLLSICFQKRCQNDSEISNVEGCRVFVFVEKGMSLTTLTKWPDTLGQVLGFR